MAEKAAALKGMKSLTEYVVRLIEEDAEKVIREHESMVVADNVFDGFIAACDKAEKPNRKLQDAVVFATRKSV